MDKDYTETSLDIRLRILEAEHTVVTEYLERLAREVSSNSEKAAHFIQSFQDALKQVRLDFLASLDK